MNRFDRCSNISKQKSERTTWSVIRGCCQPCIWSCQVQDRRGAGAKDNLKLSQVAHGLIAKREQHLTWMAEIPG